MASMFAGLLDAGKEDRAPADPLALFEGSSDGEAAVVL